MGDNEVIERIDAFCDAVPRRRARAEEYGPLVIFVPTGSGWPYYARPRRGARPPVTAADIREVRARQRELIIPESFEWIEQTAPEMAAAAAEAGLEVRAHPLMVLAEPAQVPPLPTGITVRIVAPEDTELDRIWAVPAVAFSHPGTGAGEAGAAERDKIAADHDGGTIAMLRERLRSGHSVLAAARAWARRSLRCWPRTPGTAGCGPSSCPPVTPRWPASTPGSASARSARP